MGSCCDKKSDELINLKNHTGVLWQVLAINLTMFFIEATFGIISNSMSLLADSLDMLGDTFVYGISIYVIWKSLRQNAFVALIKGVLMMAFALAVVSKAIYNFITPTSIPLFQTMGVVGGIALVANLSCAFLLFKHRSDNLNMRSTWLCSRNDVIANIGVLLAAGTVYITQSKYPDLVVGMLIASLFLSSSFGIIKESFMELKLLQEKN